MVRVNNNVMGQQHRDSLELASLASSDHSDHAPSISSEGGPSSSRNLSFEDDTPRAANGRPNRDGRSYSVSSAFDFAPTLFPLSATGAGYAALGTPITPGLDTAGGGLEKQKSLTFLNGLSLIVGLIIGSGIFSSPARVNINAGSPGAALIVWVVAGLLAWTGAASYAELGGAIPLNGGPQVYLSKIYGQWAGFLFTWVAVTVLKPGSAAIIAIIFGEYVMRAFQGVDVTRTTPWLDKAVALLGVTLATGLNSVSTKLGTKSTDIFMFLKFFALLSVAVIGVIVAVTGRTARGTTNNDWRTVNWFQGTSTSVSNWAVALYAGLWAYDGWDNTNYVTGEFVNPRRDLPKAIHVALSVVVVSYVVANVAYFLVLPRELIDSSNTVAVAFGHTVFGPIGSFVLALVVAGSCFGSLNATTFTSGRLIYAAGKEGYLPSLFGRLGVRKDIAVRLPVRSSNASSFTRMFADDAGIFCTPIFAMLLNMVITMIYVVVGDFATLTTFYGVAGYTFYFMTVLGLVILRVREPDLDRPYKCWITTPIIFCCISLFLLSRAVFAEPLQTLIVVAFIVAGLPLYWWRVGSKGKSRSRGRATDWKFWKRWGRS